jgi:spermidine synthase
MLVLLLFFCSGATALVYEVLWSKYLTLMLGSTVQAQTVVLAVFMGGLAIGNRVFGKHSATTLEPLRGYAILELIIGGYAFFFPRIFKLADWLFVTAGSAVVNTPVLPLIVKLFICTLLLLGPTILMGGTLPLLAAWIQRQSEFDPASRVGIFYAVNSLGAVVGAGLAGFVIVQNYGLTSGLELTALANLFVGFFAVILARRESLKLSRPETQAHSPGEVSSVESMPNAAWFGVLVALTGGVSMGLEVAFSRALAMIAGGSLQSFSLVLMSFILGIGLGSVFISSSSLARKYGIGVVYGLLISAACFVIVHVLLIEKIALLYAQAKYGLAQNQVGYIWHELAIALLALIFLGFPAACLGAVVPLAIRLSTSANTSLGDRVGRLLTANTIGAVAGVLLTGFMLMPLLGLRSALATLAILLFALAGVIAFQRQNSRIMMTSVVLVIGAIFGTATTGASWRWVMSVGLFRIRNFYVTPESMAERRKQVELLFYKDSADATVTVEKSATNQIEQIGLRINGKSDASSFGDAATQYLLAHLPMTVRPDATNAFVLGFGSGITAGALLGHPIQHLTIAENCKPVLEAGPLFAQWNRGVLTNERTRLINDDARAALKLRPDRYDVIISEPSNPWVVGVGSVFSQDFYRLCTNRLTDNGVMAQWFHKYEMADDIVFLIFRTFASVFPNMEIWDTQSGDLVLLGSPKPWSSDPAHYQVLFDRVQPSKDMAGLHINSAAVLWARQVASQKTASAIPGDGPVQTDEFPYLEYAAPKAFFLGGIANRMYLYDERTVQFQLADRTKIATMRALPNQALLDSFLLYMPSSPDIALYIAHLGGGRGAPRLDPMGHLIFRAPDSYPEDPPIGSKARTEVVECVKAEVGLLRDEAHWKTYAEKIEQILTGMIGKDDVRPTDFRPTYYAALAVRNAIGHDDYQTALRALRLGFVFDSNEEQLTYLSRVLDRVVPPDVLQRAKAADKLPK